MTPAEIAAKVLAKRQWRTADVPVLAAEVVRLEALIETARLQLRQILEPRG